jgi:UDP-N-acetylmuramoyl-L-alanyl-D-glutamate--2,6-diaminopimelate ligase
VRLHDLLGALDVLDLRDGSSRAEPEPETQLARDPEIAAVVHDSRDVGPGALLCCVPGRRTDGHDHAVDAVAAGAVALVVERFLPLDVPQVRVGSVRLAMGPLAARFHGDPARAMTVLGVTGTNGKTTVTYLLDAIGRAAGLRTAVVGTTGVRLGGDVVETGFTTPEATELQALLARMRDDGVQLVAMEVSSHALAQHRVDGTRFAVAGFTNLGQDHLDLHGSIDEYRAAKARLFTAALTDCAVVNGDVPALYDRAAAEVPTFSYSTRGEADLWARDVATTDAGSTFVMANEAIGDARGRAEAVHVGLPGAFNVENALCAAGMAFAVGLDWGAVRAGLESTRRVPGRLERVDLGTPFAVYVDYAHTPDGLASVLDAARAEAAGRVLAVFGCGGDRDPTKRAPMGRAVGERADLVVLTSDNPRSEDPASIAAAAEVGLRASGARYEVELDRRRAIRRALGAARPGDVVLVLGKGSEQGQTAGGVTVPFDDRVVVREELGASA